MSGNDPAKVAKLRASYKWLPFDEKSEEERAMILAGRSAFDSARVLYENWAEIFEEIENETPDFYKFTHEKQQSVIEEKVEKWRGKIQLASEPTFEPIQP
jgi:CRISPR/Cas system-associated protein Csx1